MKTRIIEPFDDTAPVGIPSKDQSEEPANLLAKLEALLSGSPSDLRGMLLREMVSGIVKFHEQPIDVLDIKIVTRALKELRYAFQVFQPYAHCLKVSIYGSARTPQDHRVICDRRRRTGSHSCAQPGSAMVTSCNLPTPTGQRLTLR